MRAVPLLLLVCLVIPAFSLDVVTAQVPVPVLQPTVAVSIEDPGRALVPGRNETVPLRVNFIWPSGARPEVDPATTNRTKNTTITLTIKQVPSWVTEAHVYPGVVQLEWPSTSGIGGNKVIDNISVNLTLDPNAPALEREEIIVVAVSDPNGNMLGATGENPGVKVRANIVPTINVTAEPFLVLPGGRWSIVPFTVANEGNYDLTVALNLTTTPENSETRFPKQVEIKRGQSVVVEVEIRLPWTESELGTVELEATPILQDEDGKPASMAVDVQGTSAVPATGALPLLSLVAVALATRRLYPTRTALRRRP